MIRASNGPGTPQRNMSNILDLMRAMSVKVSVNDGKISNQTTMEKGLERFDEIEIVAETNGFGLDFATKTESGLWTGPSQRGGAGVLQPPEK